MRPVKEMFLIWSNEHNAWWRPNRLGYTPEIAAAGRYFLEDAIAICNEANVQWSVGQWQVRPSEMPISETAAMMLQPARA